MANLINMKTLSTSILDLVKGKASDVAISKVTSKLGDLMKSFSVGLGGVMKTGQYRKAKIVIYDDNGKPFIVPEVEFHEGENGIPGNFSYCIRILEEDEKDSYVIAEDNTAIVRVDDNEVLFKDLVSILIELFKGSIKNKCVDNVLNIKQDGYFDMAIEMDEDQEIHIDIIPDGAMKRLIKNDFIIEK